MLFFSQDTERFASLDEASLTLFSCMNGDDLQNSIRSTDGHPIVSRFYFYTFLFIAIYAVANIFIAIIEDAYFSVKGNGHNSYSPIERAANRKHAEETMNQDTDLINNEELWNNLISQQNREDIEEHDPPLSSESSNEDVVKTVYAEIAEVIETEQKQFQSQLEQKINSIISKRLGTKQNTKIQATTKRGFKSKDSYGFSKKDDQQQPKQPSSDPEPLIKFH